MAAKKNKKRKKKSERGSAKPKMAKLPKSVTGVEDLRAVPYHVDQWRLAGVEEALNTLIMLGRDASYQVQQIAKEREDAELTEFARTLVAVKPQIDTNLYALREASVRAHLDEAGEGIEDALGAQQSWDVSGGAISVFDPVCVLNALVKGGRPRKDRKSLNEGDLAWFGLRSAAPTKIHLSSDYPSDDVPVLQLKVRVESGLIYVGPPAASDGPRLGAVRLDPLSTGFDAFVDQGRMLRITRGTYGVRAHYDDDGEVHICFAFHDPGDLDLDPNRLALP